MFHVKHRRRQGSDVVINESFTNAEIAENHVEDVFDINATSEAAERRRG
jgi:hypothetical protein